MYQLNNGHLSHRGPHVQDLSHTFPTSLTCCVILGSWLPSSGPCFHFFLEN